LGMARSTSPPGETDCARTSLGEEEEGWSNESFGNLTMEPMRRQLAPPGKGRAASRKRVLRGARVTVAAKRRQRACRP